MNGSKSTIGLERFDPPMKATDSSIPAPVCDISGLPITCKPEWVTKEPDKDYQLRVNLLGERIIISQPQGNINQEAMQKFLGVLDTIRSQFIPTGQSYILVEDFVHLRRTSLEARRMFIEGVQRCKRLRGIVFCNISPLMRISIKLGKRLYKGDMQICLADGQPQAVRLAMELLSPDEPSPADAAQVTIPDVLNVHPGGPTPPPIEKGPWALNFDTFSTQFSIIHGNILHSVSKGSLNVDHIAPVAELRERIQQSLKPDGGIEYIVADVARLKGGSRLARKRYVDSLRQWHKTHPMRMLIFFGANQFMRAASHLAGPFLPFKVRVADDLQHALAIVAKDQQGGVKPSPQDNSTSASRSKVNIHQYVTELLEYLGTIDWERDGLNQYRKPERGHPFAPVFDAIALIKSELDELIQERNDAEDALRRINDSLEAKVQERTLAIKRANQELKIEITAREKSQAALKQAKQSAERANQAKSAFLANMSHELRTPLNHILGFTEIVLDQKMGSLNARQEKYLTNVHDSSRHLLSLINDILDLSKVEAEKTDLELTAIDLASLLENSITMVEVKAMNHDIRLSLEVANAPHTISADERKLKQIMYNLLSNAVKFTPRGGSISVTAERYESENPARVNGRVKITVSDTGIGLNPEDLERIFIPFEQADNTARRVFLGTGLGLSLSKCLVELHGGRLWAESPGIDKGSSFHLILPASITPPEKLS